MKLRNFLKQLFLAGILLSIAASSIGQVTDIGELQRDYLPGKEKPVPVSLSGFTGEAEAVIRLDLTVQGFAFTTPETAQYLLSGSANENLTGRAQDRFNKNMLVNKSYTGASLRRQAHAFVDDFLAALGRKGVGQTKIAFKAGEGANSEICIADFDGFGRQVITSEKNIVAAPAWVPGHFALCYGSYRANRPDIYHHDLGTGRLTKLAYYPGSNISPAPSPDGSKVAMILSKSGMVDLYVADIDGSHLRQLTKSKEDESSPCWSPDGQWICYAGKINERRALWKVPVVGGASVRIPTSGVSNPSEPDWSPDGKWIVFTAQMGGFEICVVPAAGGTAIPLVSGEDPSWAPNSRTVVYAQRARSGGRRLSLLDVPTKQTKDVSRLSGINSQPSWAK
jgi:TolB protein